MCTDSASLEKSKWSLIVRALSALRPNSRQRREQEAGGLHPQRIRLLLLEVAVQLRLDEDDAVDELLDNLVLVSLVRRADLLLFSLCLLVDLRLNSLGVPRVLFPIGSGGWRVSNEHRGGRMIS